MAAVAAAGVAAAAAVPGDEPPPPAPCSPTAELLDAAPALREGGWGDLPAAARYGLPSEGRPQWLRRLAGRELELWAVARCDEGMQACLLATYEGRWTAQPCGTPEAIRAHGVWWLFPVAGRLGVAGFAPPSTRGVEMVLDDETMDEIPLTDGVFGAVLPPAFGSSVDPGEGDMTERLDLRFR